MRHPSQRTGAILIEFLFAILAALLIGSSLVVLIQCTYTSQNIIQSENLTFSGARKTLDVLAAHIRNAQAYQTLANPVTHATLSYASASSVTCYTDAAGNTERYWLDAAASPPALKRTQTVNGAATTTIVVSGVQSLQFTYYLTNGTTYTSSSWVSTTSAPAATDLPAIGAISIAATITINGYQQQLTSFVRLRNSPYRS